MSFHRNAKLGLGGRSALVGAIEGGLSIRAAADRFNVSPATAHRWWHRWREADEESRRTLACLFAAPANPTALRVSSRPSCRSGSAPAGARPAGDHGWLPRRPASPTRLFGRCSAGRGSHARRGPRRSPPTGTSGPAPVTCCTWTSLATRASCGQATRSPAIARSVLAAG